jgi:glucose-1-phosphate adenylyltransferase
VEQAKPALPFANGYRIVDFVLSNLVNSGISAIYVLAQYKPTSLIRHIETAWAQRVHGKRGFIRPVLPERAGCFRGTADAVYQNLRLIEKHHPDVVVVFAADHVYRMDIAQMVSFHEACDADVTVAAVPVPIESASSFGVILTDPDGKIREFQEKPAQPAAIPGDAARAYASMGNYVFDPNVLIGLLDAAERCGSTDFGRDVLPRLPGRGRIFSYDFATNRVPGVQPHEQPAYWRDVGTLDTLASAQHDVEGPQPRFDLSNQLWPMHGAGTAAPTAVREPTPRIRETRRRGGPRQVEASASFAPRASTRHVIPNIA